MFKVKVLVSEWFPSLTREPRVNTRLRLDGCCGRGAFSTRSASATFSLNPIFVKRGARLLQRHWVTWRMLVSLITRFTWSWLSETGMRRLFSFSC